MADRVATLADVLTAIQDLTRVSLALSEKYPSKSERVRRLGELEIPPSRIAVLLGMSSSDVTSVQSKAKKKMKSAIPDPISDDDVTGATNEAK
jgi:hypothetical protein